MRPRVQFPSKCKLQSGKFSRASPLNPTRASPWTHWEARSVPQAPRSLESALRIYSTPHESPLRRACWPYLLMAPCGEPRVYAVEAALLYFSTSVYVERLKNTSRSQIVVVHFVLVIIIFTTYNHVKKKYGHHLFIHLWLLIDNRSKCIKGL